MNPPRQQTRPPILTQMEGRLSQIFTSKIDMKDLKSKTEEEKKQHFTSRAYAALFLMHELRISPDEAGAAITDGGDDDGIDAIYIDKKNHRIYLIQSKWKQNLNSGVPLVEFTRFRDGVYSLINLIWSAENKNLHRFKDDFEEQLSNIDAEIIMVFAHNSEQALSRSIETKKNEFLDQQNKFSELIRFKEFRLTEAAGAARSYTRPSDIDVTVMLSSWGRLSQPFEAVYGSVSASDVVAWLENHGNAIFAENLRYGLEKSDVNEAIINTATTEPQLFWYYNNGITAICDSIRKQAIGGANTDNGVFDVKKISVINGAQTISSLGKVKQTGRSLDQIKVHIRIISLEKTADDFASCVTHANNTQNNLSPVDFVSVDPEQDRIRREALAQGWTYVYRRGDKDPEKEAGFDIRQATIAAACASGDLRLAVAAKRYISGLWENTKKDPYTSIFNNNTSAVYLWNIVNIMRTVDDELKKIEDNLAGRDKLIAIHGNRFVLFCVYNYIKSTKNISRSRVADYSNLARESTHNIMEKLKIDINDNFVDAYPGNIFKNTERQLEILSRMSI